MIWRPYQQMKTARPPLEIVDARGPYLYTKNAKLLDSISSWWCVVHGHKHPVITEAIVNQAQRFSHVMAAGLTHEPMEKLAEKLSSMLPGDLDYVFFSDSGSVSVEVALKMALQYYVNRGDLSRTKVLALKHGYHGDTFKAMEVSDNEEYHYLLNARGKSKSVIHIPTEIDALESAFSQWGRELNSFIVEPLLQGAGGMRTYDVAFLKRARELCDKYDALLIFDEVATGFGRTGNRFVADLVAPDIICLGKALTGGYIGGAATVANKRVFDAFYDTEPRKAFMHGPTFMGNPLMCSAALASISLFENDSYLEKIAKIEETTRAVIGDFRDERIREIRVLGASVCIETREASTLSGYVDFALERGVFARPFSNYLYAMVPYVVTESELVLILNCMKEWFKKS